MKLAKPLADDPYRRVKHGAFAVINYDGEVYPDRWATEEDAWEFGVTGKYLLTGLEVVRRDGAGSR